MEEALGGLRYMGIEMPNGECLCDLVYADNIVCLFETSKRGLCSADSIRHVSYTFNF